MLYIGSYLQQIQEELIGNAIYLEIREIVKYVMNKCWEIWLNS